MSDDVETLRAAVLTAADDYAVGYATGLRAELDEAYRIAVVRVAEIETLHARVKELEDGPQEPPEVGMWVGADVNVPSGNTLANFQAADAKIGPLRVRRSFPTAGSLAQLVAADKAARLVSFPSLKPPLTDAQLETVARSLPAGTYFTYHHEPENDTTGSRFVDMFCRAYDVVKNANPDVIMGPVHMSYWWHPTQGTGSGTKPRLEQIGGPGVWTVPVDACDFYGVDDYSGGGGTAMLPLSEDAEFQSWYQSMPDGKPLVIAEYGRYARPINAEADPVKQAKRAELIAADHEWIKAEGRVTCWLYWNAIGTQGSWELTDPASQAAWRAVAAEGRTT